MHYEQRLLKRLVGMNMSYHTDTISFSELIQGWSIFATYEMV